MPLSLFYHVCPWLCTFINETSPGVLWECNAPPRRSYFVPCLYRSTRLEPHHSRNEVGWWVCLFLNCCDKMPQLKRSKRSVSLGSQSMYSIMAGRPQQHECEAAGHVASTIRKQRDECWYPVHYPFPFNTGPCLWDSATKFRVGLPSLDNPGNACP